MSGGVGKGCPGSEEAPRMAIREFFSNRSVLWWAGLPIRVILAGMVFMVGAIVMPGQLQETKAAACELLEGRMS